jgi:Dolichyl-phosphate-mannose-protein mannosyltransferase
MLAIYLLISCWNLPLPGLEYDEVLFANAALGHLDETFIAYELRLGQFRLPLMLMNYIGALKAYLYFPLFELFPVSPVTVRLPAIMLGAVALVATYLVLLRLANRRAALWAGWLLATDPSFIFHTRIDFGPTVLMMFFKMTSLLALVTFCRTKRPSFLALGSFLIGLGVFDKANFLWYVAGLWLASLVVWRKGVLAYVSVRNVLICAFFLILGSLPFIYYNMATGGATFKEKLFLPVDFPVSLRTRTALLIETINGSGIYKFANGLKPAGSVEALASFWPGTITPWALAGCALFSLRRWRIKPQPVDPIGLFFTLLSLLIVVEIYLTRLPVGWHHFMMLWPFHYMALCTLLLRSDPDASVHGECLAASKWVVSRNLPVAVLIGMMTSNLFVDAIYLRSFSTEGGRGFFSDAIYQLAEHAQGKTDQRLLLMDWGFSTQLLLLSRGSIRKEEVFWELRTPGNEEQQMSELHKRALQPNSLFVFHAPPYTVFERPRELFENMLQRYKLRSETVKVFFHRRGDPAFLLLRVAAPE